MPPLSMAACVEVRAGAAWLMARRLDVAGCDRRPGRHRPQPSSPYPPHISPTGRARRRRLRPACRAAHRHCLNAARTTTTRGSAAARTMMMWVSCSRTAAAVWRVVLTSKNIRAGERPLFPFQSPKYLTSLTRRWWHGAAVGVPHYLPRASLLEALPGNEPGAAGLG
ncbi:Os05g0422800 [Oryza sativa Japonica Group]|uniref:Os05g0422800 protein n=1 Tax=Oryza sativa subsp. japonica TaxID=39947 RepID=A0A0P0WMK5_ORYSJ|nr:Os05g0422800 [Oryza sativa Japonica Group]